VRPDITSRRKQRPCDNQGSLLRIGNDLPRAGLPQGVPSDKPSLRKAAIAVLRVRGARLREQLRTPTSYTVTPDRLGFGASPNLPQSSLILVDRYRMRGCHARRFLPKPSPALAGLSLRRDFLRRDQVGAQGDRARPATGSARVKMPWASTAPMCEKSSGPSPTLSANSTSRSDR